MDTIFVVGAAYGVWDQILPMLAAPLAIALLIVIPVLVIRAGRKARRVVPAPLQVAADEPAKVHFVFHRYSGFLLFVKQNRYDCWLPIPDAERLLKQLVRHNLTWGLLVYGGVLVPFFTYFEWRSQKKRIATARPGFPVSLRA